MGVVDCIGVVSECCCKEVYRFPHNIIITFPYSTCDLAPIFLQQHPYFVHFLNVFRSF